MQDRVLSRPGSVPLVSPELTAVIRHLSGLRRGHAEAVVERTLEILVGADAEVTIRVPGASEPSGRAALLHRAGPTYELEAASGSGVCVNGEPFTGHRLLSSGDLIELEGSDALLRFRLYSPGVIPTKSLAEIFSDSMDGARRDSQSRLGRLGSFVKRFVHDAATQTAARIRTCAVYFLLYITDVAFNI